MRYFPHYARCFVIIYMLCTIDRSTRSIDRTALSMDPSLVQPLTSCFCRGERRKHAGKKVRLIRISNTRSWVLHAHHWTTRAGQRLHEGQMMELATDPLTLPAQLKTKTILYRPRRRLKHYIGLIIKTIVICLQFNHLRALQYQHRMICSIWPSIVNAAWSIDGCATEGSIDSSARSIDRADQ